jgi:hypothetical protein
MRSFWDVSQVSYPEVGLQVIYAGSELDDSATLIESQVEDGSILFLVQRTVKSVAVIVKTLKVACCILVLTG